MFHGRKNGIIGILTYSDYFQPQFLNTRCAFVGETKAINSTCDILPHPKVHWSTLELRVFACVGCRHAGKRKAYFTHSGANTGGTMKEG